MQDWKKADCLFFQLPTEVSLAALGPTNIYYNRVRKSGAGQPEDFFCTERCRYIEAFFLESSYGGVTSCSVVIYDEHSSTRAPGARWRATVSVWIVGWVCLGHFSGSRGENPSPRCVRVP
jgi:hypothetical protein